MDTVETSWRAYRLSSCFAKERLDSPWMLKLDRPRAQPLEFSSPRCAISVSLLPDGKIIFDIYANFLMLPVSVMKPLAVGNK